MCYGSTFSALRHVILQEIVSLCITIQTYEQYIVEECMMVRHSQPDEQVQNDWQAHPLKIRDDSSLLCLVNCIR